MLLGPDGLFQARFCELLEVQPEDQGQQNRAVWSPGSPGSPGSLGSPGSPGSPGSGFCFVLKRSWIYCFLLLPSGFLPKGSSGSLSGPVVSSQVMLSNTAIAGTSGLKMFLFWWKPPPGCEIPEGLLLTPLSFDLRRVALSSW